MIKATSLGYANEQKENQGSLNAKSTQRSGDVEWMRPTLVLHCIAHHTPNLHIIQRENQPSSAEYTGTSILTKDVGSWLADAKRPPMAGIDLLSIYRPGFHLAIPRSFN